jgi:hypothetical protein
VHLAVGVDPSDGCTIVRPDDIIAESKTGEHAIHRRLGVEPAIRCTIDDPPVDVVGLYVAACGCRSLEHSDIDTVEAVGSCQPRDAAAYNHDT